MAFFTSDTFVMPSRRHTFVEGTPINRSSRSWTSNGVDYHVESTNYANPGFAFGMMGRAASDRAQPQSESVENASRRRGTGLLGTAINLIGSTLAAGLAQRAEQNARRQPRRSSVDDLAYGDNHGNDQRSTLFSDFTQRESADSHRERRGSTRGQSPRRRRPQGGETRRSRSYRSEDHQPSRSEKRSAYVEDFTDSEGDDSSMDEESLVETLENAAKHHYSEAIKCKERAQRLLQRATTDPERLQRLVDDFKKHESAYETARENLKLLQDDRHSKSSRPRATFTFGTSQSRRTPQNEFEDFLSQTQGLHRPPFSQHFAYSDGNSFRGVPFGDFSSFFNDFARGSPLGSGFPQFFSMHGTSFHGRAQPNATSMPHGNTYSSQAGPSYFTPPPQPSPPANLLKPDEAKHLFKIYNERWNSLGPTDPNIPYPARKLHPSSLLSRDSIWAPNVTSSISEWSQEVVMQANAQAFYLGVVGLSPQYTETPGSGKIAMAYSKPRATAAEVNGLVDILKKEKARWHSDRLGRRNGGAAGVVNEALQRDEKARAVFHAVCELMEVAQGS